MLYYDSTVISFHKADMKNTCKIRVNVCTGKAGFATALRSRCTAEVENQSIETVFKPVHRKRSQWKEKFCFHNWEVFVFDLPFGTIVTLKAENANNEITSKEVQITSERALVDFQEQGNNNQGYLEILGFVQD